jgi:pyrroline-5-carboxylate reductase
VNNTKIAILGSGSMGTAILDGLIASGINAANITVSTLSAASALNIKNRYGVSLAFSVQESDQEEENANISAVDDADVIIVAVKPTYVLEVLGHLTKPELKEDALVISVAAGITTEAMQNALIWGNPVVRAMPNTPAIVGRAVTGIALGSRATEEHLKITEELFATIGKTLVVDEDRIDALSTISGSGPAYVFLLVEELTKAAKHQGFSDEEAALLVNETFLGASELLVASGKAPEDLRRQVTSPNGTTMQAIARMQEANLDQMFIEATDAALARAREIAAGK